MSMFEDLLISTSMANNGNSEVDLTQDVLNLKWQLMPRSNNVSQFGWINVIWFDPKTSMISVAKDALQQWWWVNFDVLYDLKM